MPVRRLTLTTCPTYVYVTTYTHIYTHTHSLSLSLSLSHTQSRTVSHTHTHTHTHTLSLSLSYIHSLSYTQTYTHTHRASQTHTHSLSLSFSLSFIHTHFPYSCIQTYQTCMHIIHLTKNAVLVSTHMSTPMNTHTCAHHPYSSLLIDSNIACVYTLTLSLSQSVSLCLYRQGRQLTLQVCLSASS